MAFFNLWSSERLSFSLSVVAVISASITSYYQFFYHSTEVSYYREVFHLRKLPTLKDGIYHDSIVGSITFMNRGSTPVSIISSAVILDGDTSQIPDDDYRENPYLNFNQGVLWGDSIREAVHTHSKHYLDSKSVSEFQFEAKIDSSNFRRLLRNANTPDWEGWDSTEVILNYHLWFLVADPYGNFSMEAVKIENSVYNKSGRYLYGWGLENGYQTKQMPPFQNIDAWNELTSEKTRKRMSTTQGAQ